MISIHTLCEEGDEILFTTNVTGLISIHTLCEEGDNTVLAIKIIV